jgi:hypothetical protein
MKLLALSCILLLLLSQAVFASHLATEAKISPKRAREFKGLQGIAGVNVEPSEPVYGPQKPFGKPRPKRIEQIANLPPHYKGLEGIASAYPSATQLPCSQFGCKPGKNIVANTVTKEFFRCYCASAKEITKEQLTCIDTPGLAERMGYHAGKC